MTKILQNAGDYEILTPRGRGGATRLPGENPILSRTHAATVRAPAGYRGTEESMELTHTDTLDAPRNHRVTREHDRDLAFTGWQIGYGAHGSGGTSGYDTDHTRGVEVRIYLTTGGRLVTAVHRWSQWQGGEDDRYAAAAHDTPDEAREWLVSDGRRFGSASKEAWEQACETWSPLAGQDVEAVDA